MSFKLILKLYKPYNFNHFMTAFKQRVFSLVKKIPVGKVTTYGQIAYAMNSKAYQAIGNILARNDYGFLDGGTIPCHRVVRSDGTVGGYCGYKCGKLVCEKKKILKKEGIKFNSDKIVDFESRLFKFKK